MARRVKDPFPPEHEAECVQLLETFGSFADIKGVAEYFGVTPLSLAGFLRRDIAKAAMARYIPGTREAIQANKSAYAPTDEARDPALPDDERLLDAKGMFVEEPYTGGPILSKRTNRLK